MQSTLKSCFAGLAYYSGLFLVMRAIHRRLFGDGIRILFHHRVELGPGEPDALGRLPLTAEKFDRQLRHLGRFWRVIRLEEAADLLVSGRPLPSNTVIITLDDGYRDNLTVALPRLQKHKLPATVFVVSGAIDGQPLWFDQVDRWFRETTVPSLRFGMIEKELSLRSPAGRHEAAGRVLAALKTLGGDELAEALAELRNNLGITTPDCQAGDRAMMSWEEVRRLAASELITLGAHTVTHPILTYLGRDQVREEIRNPAGKYRRN